MSIEFEVIQAAEGGYAAACYKERIFTEGYDLEELYENIKKAIDERFVDRAVPEAEDIKLIVFREEGEVA